MKRGHGGCCGIRLELLLVRLVRDSDDRDVLACRLGSSRIFRLLVIASSVVEWAADFVILLCLRLQKFGSRLIDLQLDPDAITLLQELNRVNYLPCQQDESANVRGRRNRKLFSQLAVELG